MRGKITTLYVGGKAEVTELNRACTLKDIKVPLYGGLIEIVPGFVKYRGERCVAFCDEEGKLKNLAVNQDANLLWWEMHLTSDILVGNIVIVQSDDEFMRTL